MQSKRLEQAALTAGISPNYINAHGKPQSISAQTKQRLLDAMHPVPATVNAAPVPAVQVFIHGKKKRLVVSGKGQYQWQLTTEAGKTYQGEVSGGDYRARPLL